MKEMKVIVKAQSSARSKSGEGRLKIQVGGCYSEVRAVIFSKTQSKALLRAADNAKIIHVNKIK